MFFGLRKRAGSRRKRIADGLDFDRVPEFLLEHEKWTPFLTRMAVHCGDLPSPDGSGTLTTDAVAAGCRAIAVLDRHHRWDYLVDRGPDESRLHYKARVRLGLFYAGCLAYLVPLLGQVEVDVEGERWIPAEESFTCFWRKWGVRTRAKSKGKASEFRVAWGNKAPTTGERLLLASFFFTCQEVRYVWPTVARGVLDYILPGEFGVFDMMLAEDRPEAGHEAVLPQLIEGGDGHAIRAWQES